MNISNKVANRDAFIVQQWHPMWIGALNEHGIWIGIFMIALTVSGVVFFRPIYTNIIGEPNNELGRGNVYERLDIGVLDVLGAPRIDLTTVELRHLFSLNSHFLDCITNPINWSLVEINYNSILNSVEYLMHSNFHPCASNCINSFYTAVAGNWSILLHSTCPSQEVLKTCFQTSSNVLTILANNPSCIAVLEQMPEYTQRVAHLVG